MSDDIKKSKILPCMIMSDITKISPGQEFRILAYDRLEDEYVFIDDEDRKDLFDTMMLGSMLTIFRYLPEKAYIFKQCTQYRSFGSELKAGIAWANEHAIEERLLPGNWTTESFESQENRAASHIADICQKPLGINDHACYHYNKRGSKRYGGAIDSKYNQKQQREVEYHI